MAGAAERVPAAEMTNTDRAKASPWLTWLPVVVAAGLLPIANGTNSVPIAAWLAPVFLLRLARTQRVRVWLPILYVLQMSGFAFQFRGMVPIPGFFRYVFYAASTIPLLAQYLVDRWLAPRLHGVTATLVFPVTATGVGFLTSLGPYSTWSSVAYSQYGDLPLLQLLSVTGLWGITFLIYWFAAVVNGVWTEGLGSRAARKGAGIFAAILLLVLLGGGLRLTAFAPAANTVRVASLSRATIQPEPSDGVWQHVFDGTATSADVAAFTAWAKAVDDELLVRTEREAKAGAKIVFWAEGNGTLFKEDEPALIARGRELATRYRVYLGMGLGTWNHRREHPLENKLILIAPNGQVAWEYFKAHPVPGLEASVSVTTDGKLPHLDTPYGRLSSIICFDGDFPSLLAQAGALGADIVLDPADDWRAIDPWHTQMASFRAIEQGVNLVRQTSFGLSAAYDFQGRRLAAMDHFQSDDRTLVAQLPMRGVRTLYSRLGDWLAWLCLAGLALLIVAATRGGRQTR